MSLIANALGLPKVDTVVSRARSRVEQRVFKQVVGKAEHDAKRELSDIASEEVSSVIDEMLGDKANSFFVRRFKYAVVRRASQKLVDQMWEDVKAKLKESVTATEAEPATAES